MEKITVFIENNFPLMVVLGAILGFIVPGLGDYADETVIVMTGILIFMSCADIKPVDFLSIDVFQMGLFTVLRFIVLPILLFYGVQLFYPQFAVGALLLALTPAGVAVAAICSMSNANVILGLSLTVITSLLAPVFIPGVFGFIGEQVSVDLLGLFLTLTLVVFFPILIYFGVFAKFETAKTQIKKYSKAVPVLVLSLIFMIVIASQRDKLFSDPDIIFHGLFVMTLLFLVFYLFGIVYSLFIPKGQRVPYILASGVMNNSLAIGLAFAYFDSVTIIFIILSELLWNISVALVTYGFAKVRTFPS